MTSNLRFRAIEAPLSLGGRHAFKIAKRLVERDDKPEVMCDTTDLGWRSVIGQKIVFEDFNTIETGRRDGLELLFQFSAQ